MNSRFLSIALGTALTVVVAAVVVYRLKQPHGKTEAAHALLIRDRSDSTTSGCLAIGGLAKEYLRSGNSDRFSAIIAMATGDGRSNDEPVEFARLTEVHKIGAREGRQSIARKEAAIIDELVRRCEEQGGADRSPIYLAIRRGIEELRTLGCHEGTNCVLFLQSDMAENGEPGLRKALLGDKNAILPTPIDNRGIAVHICGTAQTSGLADRKGKVVTERRLRGAKRADTNEAIWRREFIVPNLVTFEPVCPTAGRLGDDVVADSGESKGRR
jgi:hypothetical protein